MHVTIIDTYTHEEKCDQEWNKYASLLKRKGLTRRYGVRKVKVPVNESWSVWRLELVDRERKA